VNLKRIIPSVHRPNPYASRERQERERAGSKAGPAVVAAATAAELLERAIPREVTDNRNPAFEASLRRAGRHGPKRRRDKDVERHRLNVANRVLGETHKMKVDLTQLCVHGPLVCSSENVFGRNKRWRLTSHSRAHSDP
jgi:hypothetical protein